MIKYINLKCKECKALFRITALNTEIEHFVCPCCGSDNCDYMPESQEEAFEEYI